MHAARAKSASDRFGTSSYGSTKPSLVAASKSSPDEITEYSQWHSTSNAVAASKPSPPDPKVVSESGTDLGYPSIERESADPVQSHSATSTSQSFLSPVRQVVAVQGPTVKSPVPLESDSDLSALSEVSNTASFQPPTNLHNELQQLSPPDRVAMGADKAGDSATQLGRISSSESLTGSEVSVTSRRSLPASLGSVRSAFSTPLARNASLQHSGSLSQLKEEEAATNKLL